jgi:hypothetical protein
MNYSSQNSRELRCLADFVQLPDGVLLWIHVKHALTPIPMLLCYCDLSLQLNVHTMLQCKPGWDTSVLR